METVSDVAPPIDVAQARAHWKGQYRYTKIEEGERIVLPDCFGTPYWKPEEIERQICVGVDDKGKPLWEHCPDAPAPPNLINREGEGARSEDFTRARPPFDWKPPAYASDTQSGGPANFDGRHGGAENPRDPALEGEVPGEYQQALKEFQETMSLMMKRVNDLEQVILEGDDDKLAKFAEVLRGKQTGGSKK